MNLILGLGNPGARFAATRHNVGFRVLEICAHRLGLRFRRPLFSAYRTAYSDARETLFVEPLTFMNRVGEVLPPLAGRYRVDLDRGDSPDARLVVVCDTLDLPVGRIRVRFGGGSAAHNGLKSLLAVLGHGDFVRIYVGIGHPGSRELVVDHVLGVPRDGEADTLTRTEELAADAVLEAAIPTGPDMEGLMSRYNGVSLADRSP